MYHAALSTKCRNTSTYLGPLQDLHHQGGGGTPPFQANHKMFRCYVCYVFHLLEHRFQPDQPNKEPADNDNRKGSHEH